MSRGAVLALTLGLFLGSTAPVQAGAVQIQLTGAGGARLAGDHETVSATVTNTGSTPLHDVLVMLSLLDVTGTPATPLGLEDWTPAPEAARATTVPPAGRVTGTWQLRMIQAGRLAVYATVITGTDRTVTNSRPLVLDIAPTKNLTAWTVMPVAIGVPLLGLGTGWMLVSKRRRVLERRALVLLAAAFVSVPSVLWAAADAADVPEGLRIVLTAAGGPVKTGDRVTISATVTNATGRPVSGATLLLGLVDMTPGRAAPLGLETWTADPESVALPLIAAGGSASAAWRLVMIQPGPLGVFASLVTRPDTPLVSSRLTVLAIRDRRVLNPAHVLPVALTEPAVLIGLVVAVRFLRRSARP